MYNCNILQCITATFCSHYLKIAPNGVCGGKSPIKLKRWVGVDCSEYIEQMTEIYNNTQQMTNANIDAYNKLLQEYESLQMKNSELLAQNAKLVKEDNEMTRLTRSNNSMQQSIQDLQDRCDVEICEYFNGCNSIGSTADEFGYEDVADCYHSLVDYLGDSSSVDEASDFIALHQDIFDCAYGEDDETDEEDSEADETAEEETAAESTSVDSSC